MRQSISQGSADSVPVSSLPSPATPCVFALPETYSLSTAHYPLSADGRPTRKVEKILGAPASSCEAGLLGLREAILNGIDGDQPRFSSFIGQITAPQPILRTPY